MRPTRGERLKGELEASERAEWLERRLGEMVKQFDLDYSPPFSPQEEAITIDWAPRRYPQILKLWPRWEYLPPEQRLNAILIVKFDLMSRKLSLEDGPAIQEAIAEVLEKKGRSDDTSKLDPVLFKFKK